MIEKNKEINFKFFLEKEINKEIKEINFKLLTSGFTVTGNVVDRLRLSSATC